MLQLIDRIKYLRSLLAELAELAKKGTGRNVYFALEGSSSSGDLQCAINAARWSIIVIFENKYYENNLSVTNFNKLQRL